MEKIESITTTYRFQEGTAHIWEKLAQIPRTGWLQWEIPNPETVAEHIDATRALALKYRHHLPLSEAEFQDVLDIIEVHDWPEALVGDEVIMGDEENWQDLREAKHRRERQAMEELIVTIPNGRQALALYERYEAQSDTAACYAKELDKLQAVLQASEYEKRYGKTGLLAEFVDYTRDSITLPYLRQEFAIMTGAVSPSLL